MRGWLSPKACLQTRFLGLPAREGKQHGTGMRQSNRKRGHCAAAGQPSRSRTPSCQLPRHGPCVRTFSQHVGHVSFLPMMHQPLRAPTAAWRESIATSFGRREGLALGCHLASAGRQERSGHICRLSSFCYNKLCPRFTPHLMHSKWNRCLQDSCIVPRPLPPPPPAGAGSPSSPSSPPPAATTRKVVLTSRCRMTCVHVCGVHPAKVAAEHARKEGRPLTDAAVPHRHGHLAAGAQGQGDAVGRHLGGIARQDAVIQAVPDGCRGEARAEGARWAQGARWRSWGAVEAAKPGGPWAALYAGCPALQLPRWPS